MAQVQTRVVPIDEERLTKFDTSFTDTKGYRPKYLFGVSNILCVTNNSIVLTFKDSTPT